MDPDRTADIVLKLVAAQNRIKEMEAENERLREACAIAEREARAAVPLIIEANRHAETAEANALRRFADHDLHSLIPYSEISNAWYHHGLDDAQSEARDWAEEIEERLSSSGPVSGKGADAGERCMRCSNVISEAHPCTSEGWQSPCCTSRPAAPAPTTEEGQP